MMKKTALFVAGGLALASIPALAAMHGGHPMGKGGFDRTQPQQRSAVEARVKDHFTKVDANKDGFVTQEEMASARQAHHAEMMQSRFTTLDKDANGSISRAEFDAGHAAPQARLAPGAEGKAPPEDDAAMMHPRGHGKRGGHHGMRGQHAGMGGGMFAMADADKDGRVSLTEALAKPLQRFDAADTNKDGTLTPEERKAAREAMKGKWRDKRGN